MLICQCFISEPLAAVFAFKQSRTVIPKRQITAFSMLSLRCYHWGKCASAAPVSLRSWLSLCSYQCSVSDVVFGVEGSPFTADGSLVQCVSIWLTIVVVHREIFHVYWLLGHQGLQNTDAMCELIKDTNVTSRIHKYWPQLMEYLTTAPSNFIVSRRITRIVEVTYT